MNKNFIADYEDENTRLDVYLSNLFPEMSRSKIQLFIKSDNVKINSEFKKNSYKIKIGDKISINFEEINDSFICAQDIKLDVIYEDENMLVINKPSGMLTHPTVKERENTLVNALLFKFGDNLSDINGDFRRGILHRLDRNTSGLLMVAKNNKAHEFLAEQFKNKQNLSKKYLAVVKGVVKEDSGTINKPIGRHKKYPEKRAIIPEEEGGKESVTEFKVLKRFKDATYLELDLKTGRTHQIRVHMQCFGHPIVNDSLYGGCGFKIKTQEQVLQSYKLAFTKPFGDDIINVEIKPDEKINRVLNYLEKKK